MSNPELRDRIARERRQRRTAPTPIADRLGPAVLGMFAGLVLGLIVGVLLQAGDSGTIASCVFGGAAVGALLGALSMDIGLGLFEGLVHLLAGFAAGSVARLREEDDGLRRRHPQRAGCAACSGWA